MENKIEDNEEVIIMPNPQDQSDRGIILSVLKTAGLTLLGIVAFFAVLISSLAVFSPASLAKVTNEIGMMRVSATMYERQYNKSGKLTDLYNAIEAKLACNNYADAARLIKVMRTRQGYSEFCESINSSAIAASSKEKWVYVADYDAYLRAQLTGSLYKSGKISEAQEIAERELVANSNIYSWEFGALIDCILEDKNLSASDKTGKLKDFYDKDYDGSIIDELINNNLDMLQDPDSGEGVVKLKTIYQMIKIKSTFKSLKEAAGVDASAEITDINALLEKYDAALSEI